MVDLISITITDITNASFTSQVLALVSVSNIHSVYNTSLNNNAKLNLGNIIYFMQFNVQLLLITHLILLTCMFGFVYQEQFNLKTKE